MLRLQPVLKHYLWGGRRLFERYRRGDGKETVAESWEVSVHPDGASGCNGGTLADHLAHHPEEIGSDAFPVLIKYIDAAQKLSVQVHPDDAYARRVEGDNGKTEMWYVLGAEEGAGIYCGFRKACDPVSFRKALEEGTVEELLNFIPVKKGDCYLIKAGTVHAIGAGCLICEIQQSSNVTYRVYDYMRRDAHGALRPLHVDKALDVIDFSPYRDETGRGPWREVAGGSMRVLTDCGYFRCRELRLNGEFTQTEGGSFTAVNAIEGSGKIGGEQFSAGDSFFFAAGERLTAEGNATLILTDRRPCGA